MAILTESKFIEIQAGAATVATTTITFLGIGSDGTYGAKRILTHPTTSLAPITYFSNPDRTLGMDNDALFHPITNAVLTLGTTRVVRFETGVDDVIATEIWEGEDGRASMPTFFLRQLYEYLINPPAFSELTPVYIQWEPRERNARVFNVEFLSLSVGGSGESQFDLVDLRDLGGKFKGGTALNALDGLNATETGLVDREVRLRMRIVSEDTS